MWCVNVCGIGMCINMCGVGMCVDVYGIGICVDVCETWYEHECMWY